MALNLLDLFVGLIQSFYISYTIWYCTEEKDKKKLFYLTFIGILICNNFITGTFLDPTYIGVIITHILYLLFSGFIYRNILKEVIIAYSIAYLNILIYAIITRNFAFAYLEGISISNKSSLIFVVLGYLIQASIMIFSIYRIDFFKRIYKAFVNENLANTLCIITFLLDYIITLCNIVIIKENTIYGNFIEVILVSLIIILLLYFNRISNRAKNMLVLNKALEVKNNELRKIKHDYGAQISYLYGICLLERYDDLKGELKNIINNNESTLSAVEVRVDSKKKDSMLSLALKPAVEKGINVLIDERCDLSLINIKQVDLFRILSNIVNNAIRAMNGKGTIEVQAYEHFENIVIKINNNGPMIPDEHIKNIFRPGFTTKRDKEEDHGFGLSIVKELIEQSGGSISVTSVKEYTEFKMTFGII